MSELNNEPPQRLHQSPVEVLLPVVCLSNVALKTTAAFTNEVFTFLYYYIIYIFIFSTFRLTFKHFTCMYPYYLSLFFLCIVRMHLLITFITITLIAAKNNKYITAFGYDYKAHMKEVRRRCM